MLGRLRDAVADVRDAGSNATRWLGIDELAQAAAYAGSGTERWRVVGARSAVAEEPELECNAAAVECSISGGVRGHAALQALERQLLETEVAIREDEQCHPQGAEGGSGRPGLPRGRKQVQAA